MAISKQKTCSISIRQEKYIRYTIDHANEIIAFHQETILHSRLRQFLTSSQVPVTKPTQE